MPNIRSITTDANGITIVASDGRRITLTKSQLRARFLLEAGVPRVKAAAALAWWRDQVIAALGAEQVSASDFQFDPTDIDQATGDLVALRVGGGTRKPV